MLKVEVKKNIDKTLKTKKKLLINCHPSSHPIYVPLLGTGFLSE